MDLFIPIYLDEDVDVLLAVLLRARGFQAVTTVGAGQQSNSDARQLEYAIQNNLVLLTHNRVDFERLARDYFERQQDHPGVIIAARHPVQTILQRLLIILNKITAGEMKNQIVYI